MKKLSKIAFATLAGLAMIVSATSCVQIHAADEPMGDLKDQYVRGSMNNWANDNIEEGALTKNEDGTYSFIFKATAETEEFGVADKDWSSKYSKGEVKAGGEYSVIEVGSGLENAKITGLTTGEVYTMTIIAGAESLKIKVELGGELESAGYDALPFYLDGYFVQGDVLECGWKNDATCLLSGATLDKEELTVSYKASFVAKTTEGYFAIVGANDRYYAESFTVGAKDFIELTNTTDGMKSIKISGLEVDATYRLEVYTTTEGKVFAKMYKLDLIKFKFCVTGLTEGNHVWMNGTFWDPERSSWPLGWPIASWNSPAKDGYNDVVADSKGVAEFGNEWIVEAAAVLGTKYSYKYKVIACSDGKWAKADIHESSDIVVDVTVDAACIYIVTYDTKTKTVTVTKQ